jgi:hypothetical protein
MDLFHTFVLDNIESILAILFLLFLILFILFLVFIVRLGKVRKQYKRIMKVKQKQDFEQVLFQYADDVKTVLEQQSEIRNSLKQLEQQLVQKIGPVGVVRFNAFGNTGSDLSYAVALLDSEQNGVIISSIFGREESRTYAKPIVNGESSYLLTDEEKKALEAAKGEVNNS